MSKEDLPELDFEVRSLYGSDAAHNREYPRRAEIPESESADGPVPSLGEAVAELEDKVGRELAANEREKVALYHDHLQHVHGGATPQDVSEEERLRRAENFELDFKVRSVHES